MNGIREGFAAAWRDFLDRPFAQLVRLSLSRMLQGTQDGSDEVDADVGRTLALLALPGAVISFFLFDKYGSLLQVFRGVRNFNVFNASLSDEYFFIVLSMAVCGAVAVWKTESIFLDRRDYLNLAPLPIRMRSILMANIAALLLFSLLFAIDVNLISGWLFPMVVTAADGSLAFFAHMMLGHVIGVATASLFSIMSVFAVNGIAMSLLPVTTFRRVSTYLSSAIVMAIFALLSTGYFLSSMLSHGDTLRHSRFRFLPSLWFLGICERTRGTDPNHTSLAIWGVIGLAAVTVIAFFSYAICYRRHFLRTAESSEASLWSVRAGILRTAANLLDGWVLESGLERAGYRFIFQTLARNTRHRLVLAAFFGVGVMASVQTIAFSGGEPQDGLPSVASLAVGLILSFCLIFGMRFAFDLPAELRANWTFQLLVHSESRDCISLARKAILSIVLPGTWILAMPLYAARWGWTEALLHACVMTGLSVLLTEVLLANYRKIPCTCTYPKFQEGSVLGVIIVVLAFAAFSFGTAALEHWAFDYWWRFLIFVPLFGVGWYALKEHRDGLIDRDRELTFEEQGSQAMELLNLSAGR